MAVRCLLCPRARRVRRHPQQAPRFDFASGSRPFALPRTQSSANAARGRGAAHAPRRVPGPPSPADVRAASRGAGADISPRSCAGLRCGLLIARGRLAGSGRRSRLCESANRLLRHVRGGGQGRRACACVLAYRRRSGAAARHGQGGRGGGGGGAPAGIAVPGCSGATARTRGDASRRVCEATIISLAPAEGTASHTGEPLVRIVAVRGSTCECGRHALNERKVAENPRPSGGWKSSISQLRSQHLRTGHERRGSTNVTDGVMACRDGIFFIACCMSGSLASSTVVRQP